MTLDLLHCFIILQLMKISSKLQDAFNLPVAVADLFSLSTIRAMATHMASQLEQPATEVALVKQAWPDNLRPASAGQQSLYMVSLTDSSGIQVQLRLLGQEISWILHSCCSMLLSQHCMPACRFIMATCRKPLSHVLTPPQMNEPTVVAIEGELDIAALEASANSLLQRHEVLCCGFKLVGGKVVLEYQPEARLKVDIVQVCVNGLCGSSVSPSAYCLRVKAWPVLM